MLHKYSEFLFLLVLAYFLKFCGCIRGKNNVCGQFQDYKTLQQNPNCYYEPDVDLKVPELIMRYGYPFESHQLVSEDGYILNMFRVPHNGSNMNAKRQPVILQHGLSTDSKSFLLLGNDSLVFLLARNGFDVWLPNARTTQYSPQHLKYSNNAREYWNFSFHEMGVYDMPLISNFIAAETGQKIIYIGHSMGTTISYVYSSLMPEHAQANFKSIISLAPIAFLGHARGSTRRLSQFSTQINELFNSVGIFGIGLNLDGPLQALHRLCTRTPLIYFCSGYSLSTTGLNAKELIPKQLPYSVVYPQYSLKNLLHFSQLIESKRFQFFDYGHERNMKVYQSSHPPEYPVERINVPIYLLYGKNDLLSVERDVVYLYKKLKTNNKTIREVMSYSHTDFLIGKSAPEFYKTILEYLNMTD